MPTCLLRQVVSIIEASLRIRSTSQTPPLILLPCLPSPRLTSSRPALKVLRLSTGQAYLIAPHEHHGRGLSCIGFRRRDHQLGLWPNAIRYMQNRSFGAQRSITRQVMHIEDKPRTSTICREGRGSFQWSQYEVGILNIPIATPQTHSLLSFVLV